MARKDRFEVPADQPCYEYGIRFGNGLEYWGIELTKLDIWDIDRDWSSSQERHEFVHDWRGALGQLGLDGDAHQGPSFWRREIITTTGKPERVD